MSEETKTPVEWWKRFSEVAVVNVATSYTIDAENMQRILNVAEEISLTTSEIFALKMQKTTSNCIGEAHRKLHEALYEQYEEERGKQVET